MVRRYKIILFVYNSIITRVKPQGVANITITLSKLLIQNNNTYRGLHFP